MTLTSVPGGQPEHSGGAEEMVFCLNRDMKLYLATKTGLVVVQQDEDAWRAGEVKLPDHEVTTVASRDGVILVGTTDGLYRSQDGGQTWRESNEGLTERHMRWLSFHPHEGGLALAGTEPAAIFISHDAGNRWEGRPEVAELRDRFGWWLPYSPESGCVRGFAAYDDRLYAAVEVGGLLRSDDRGASWALAPGSDGRPQFGSPRAGLIHPDVHSIEVHRSSADRLYAPTGGGFYVSRDGGATWECQYVCYVRAAVVDPQDPQAIIIGPAENSSGRDGRIERTSDGGQTWELVAGKWDNHMVDRFYRIDDQLFAVTSRGHLLAGGTDGREWERILAEVPGVLDIATSF